jgi:hypothetical protein
MSTIYVFELVEGKYYITEFKNDFIESIESMINSQISEYISELANTNYTLTVSFFEDPERYQDYMEILLNIKDYEVYTVVG